MNVDHPLPLHPDLSNRQRDQPRLPDNHSHPQPQIFGRTHPGARQKDLVESFRRWKLVLSSDGFKTEGLEEITIFQANTFLNDLRLETTYVLIYSSIYSC
jgi:hypothetical protein